MGITPELNPERREFVSNIVEILDLIKSIKELTAEFRSGRKNALHSASLKSFWEHLQNGNIFYYLHPHKLPLPMNYLFLWPLVLRPGLLLHCQLTLAVLTLPVLIYFTRVTPLSSASDAQQTQR